MPAKALNRRIRAFNSANVCWTLLNGERLKVWTAQADAVNRDEPPGTILSADKNGIAVACGEGVLVIQELQLPGGKAMDSAAMLNSRAELFSPGTLLGQGN